MDETILKYRKKHRRYRFFKYDFLDRFWECKVKDKLIDIKMKSGFFCRWYKPKEE